MTDNEARLYNALALLSGEVARIDDLSRRRLLVIANETAREVLRRFA